MPKIKSKREKYRGWVFTINNYSDEEVEKVKTIKCRGIKAGLEVGDNGTPHIQGAIYFESPRSLTATKKSLGGRAHLEVMKGNWAQQDYCLKDGNIIRNEGDIQQGKRTDVIAFKDAIKRNATNAELAEEFTTLTMKYPKFINFVRTAFIPEMDGMPEVIVFWGESGSGKTKKVYELEPEVYDFAYSNSQDWWDGYIGQEAILFDDFYGQVKYSNMLKYCDRYPQRLQIKGGFTQKAWKRVYFTSNVPPSEWWKDGIRAMERRITKIINVDNSQ